MQYRPYGKTGFQVSALSFGCMRLPTTGAGEINEEEASRMLSYAIEHGLNYLDTAYGYHGGNSERFLGRALKGGYRQRVRLVTKMPVWKVTNASDFDLLLDEQLEKLQTSHIDFYLLHGLGKPRWEFVQGLGVTDWAEKAIADGRIGALGFSFHDNFEALKAIVDGYDQWAMCQVQYNYMNENEQAGTEGVKYAAARGLAVVVMEPLLGGRLVNPPENVQKLWDTAETPRTAAGWALQWLWNKPEISTVLSGMSSMAQMQENIASAEQALIGSLTSAEIELVSKVCQAYQLLSPVPCTSCRYCLPCPNGVDIPRNFAILNDGIMYGKLDGSRRDYKWIPPGKDETILASACIGCCECESKCPQGIPISKWMPYIHETLAEGKPYTGAPV
jgi:predicted aldo/keto reductase-like oxidoreductase